MREGGGWEGCKNLNTGSHWCMRRFRSETLWAWSFLGWRLWRGFETYELKSYI